MMQGGMQGQFSMWILLSDENPIVDGFFGQLSAAV